MTNDARESEIANGVAFLTHVDVKHSKDERGKRAFLQSKGLSEREIEEAFARVARDVERSSARDARDGREREMTRTSTSMMTTLTRIGALGAAAWLAWPLARERWPEASERARRAFAKAKDVARGSGERKECDDEREREGGGVRNAVERVEARELAGKVAAFAETAETAARDVKRLREELKSEASDALRQGMLESMNDVKSFLVDMRKASEEEKVKAKAASVQAEAAFKRAIDDVKKELKEELKDIIAQSPAMKSAMASPSSVDDRMMSELRADISELKEFMKATPPRRIGAPTATVAASKSAAARDWPFEASPQGSDSEESPVYTPVQSRQGDDEFTSRLLQTGGSVNSRSAPPKSAEPPHPQNFMDILEMLEAGKTPPGIRDIDDQPPNPMAAIPRTSQPPPGKPWGALVGAEPIGEDDDAMDVPIKRLVANAVESPWRPPAAPTLSRVMSQTPRSPRRSTEQTETSNNADSPAASVSKTII